MTTNNLRIAPAQQIGPLQVWPLLWENLTSHQYKVSSSLDLLEFEEFEEEDGPVVNWIQVYNPTDNPILIPSGWVVSKDLLQERTLISAEYVEPHATTARVYENRRSSSLGIQDVHCELINTSTFLKLN
jgi:hypothetical protein